ncbi:MAG TPA: hypothetical protein VFT04_11050 [Gemmatimonadales bacterium]|nr:hypothetical protein [Gemmatimonadales bacterium]
MRFHRGTSPVLYHLDQGSTSIGALTRGENDRILLSLHGFHTSDAAASAAWAAHAGRVAYEAQFAGATPATQAEVGDTLRLLLVTFRQRSEPEAIPRLVAQADGDSFRLSLGDEEIGRISPIPAAEGRPALWSMTVPVGSDAPAVFTMAAARRMWGAVRGAGLWRRMAQWESSRHLDHSRLESGQWQRT